MKQLTSIFIVALLTAAATTASAQNNPRSEIALGYTFIRSNAPPAQCGCFHWQGGEVSAAVGLAPKWQFAGEFTAVHATNQGGVNLAKPTMFTFVGGPKYRMNQTGRISPFANVFFGGTYAYGGDFVGSTSQLTLAVKPGGGMDLKLTHRWSLRAFEMSYLWTHYHNGFNDRQNNLVVSSGIVFHPGP